MAAVVRIKRRLEDEPLEALILNCKRQKTDNSSTEVLSNTPELSSTVLTLAGTIKENENILTHIKKVHLNDIKENYKGHSLDITKKLRQEHQKKSKHNRYKIVNCLRSQDIDKNEANAADSIGADLKNSSITILDVEADVNDNTIEGRNETEKYVYDLYYTSSDYLGDTELDEQQDISIYPLKDPLFFSSTEDQPDSDLDSEDSNAENNWRNDYPDEDDMLSVNEDDMVEAMKNVDLEDDLLSSDEGEEGFVYSIDSEAVGFEEDIDDTDVHRYGERYARFKARHKKGLNKSSDVRDLYYGDIDDEEDDEEANNSYY